ncbi:MAG: DegT/DnrJ/EryC1/StrS family aminotransferase [Ignavibacteriaceae bacterium]|nr:DegT/DnrJ/EryC1/StrS family aminotransferase [Ignavibacteriaceae bacterium]
MDPVTFNINPDDFKKKITSKTKAVIPVHLYGQSAEMNAIMKIAKEKKYYCYRRCSTSNWYAI